MNDLLSNYNIVVEDFEKFFNNNSSELYSLLIKYDLHSDFNLRNKDTKKVLHNFLIKKTLSLLQNKQTNYIFIIKPEIFNIHNDVYKVFKDKKIRMEILKFVRFMKKWFNYNFALLKKSYSESNDLLSSNDIVDIVNLYLFHGSKNIFNFNELSKQIYKTYEATQLK